MKLLGLTVVLGLSTLCASQAFAVTTLKKVQITDGSQIDLLFDGKVTPNQIRTEYFNDIIQVSLTDVSVYPAKINSISGSELTKVFAYQYAPKLVRCRLTVKGKAESFQDRVTVKANGKVLSIKLIDGSGDKIVQSSAAVERAAPQVNTEEQELLNHVLKGTPSPTGNSAGVAVVPTATESKKSKESSTEQQPIGRSEAASKPLTSGKPLPSPMRVILVLLGMIAVLGGALIAIKRFGARSKLQNHKGFARFMRNVTGMGTQQKMIEVLATHHLGPKKSIAMVKVAGKTLVLGVTNESINLISQINSNQVDSFDDLSVGFGDLLTDEHQKPSSGREVQAGKLYGASSSRSGTSSASTPSSTVGASVRSQIKSRLEGLKPL